MNNSSQNPQKPQLSNKVVELLVSDIFKKNKINLDQVKQNISDEQKEILRELVQDLSQQVEQFVNPTEADSKPPEKGKKIRFKK